MLYALSCVVKLCLLLQPSPLPVSRQADLIQAVFTSVQNSAVLIDKLLIILGRTNSKMQNIC